MSDKKKKYQVGPGARQRWGNYEITDDSPQVSSNPVPRKGDRDYWQTKHPTGYWMDPAGSRMGQKLKRHEIDSTPVPLYNKDGSRSIHWARKDQTSLVGSGGRDLDHFDHWKEFDKVIDRDKLESGFPQRELIRLQKDLSTRGARPGGKAEKTYDGPYEEVPESISQASDTMARGGYVCPHCETKARFAKSLKHRRR